MIIDCREERLQEIDQQLRHATSMVEVMRLMRQAHAVRTEIAASVAEVQAVAQGWRYMPPPGRPS